MAISATPRRSVRRCANCALGLDPQDAATCRHSGGRRRAVLRFRSSEEANSHAVQHPETLATAIKIGDPVSWPKALHEVSTSSGVVEKVTEQEIADAKAQIGQCGIGCEPASAATLAGIRKLTAAA